MYKNITVVIDGQAGSCGKGKICGYLAKHANFSISTNNWSSNAGHTYVDDNGKKIIVSHLPMAMVNSNCKLVLNEGCVITPEILFNEIRKYSEDILIEGSQGQDLDINYGLDYPNVTSRMCSTSQLIADAGCSPFKVKEIYMIIRPYPIRISNKTNIGIDIYSGDYAGSKEISWEEVKKRSGCNIELKEYTTVTKKVRRVFEMNWERLKYNVMINQPTQIVLNFAQYIDWKAYKCRDYKKLPNKVFNDIIELNLFILYNLYSLKFINVRKKIRMCKYYFKSDTRLSNYYMCNVKIDNLTFSSSEAAYHAEKFKQNSECLKELLDTEDMELIEDTTCWHDNIWGEYTCEECKNKEHKNYYYIRKCDMKLTSKEALDLLNENIGKTSSDKWIKHSKNVGYVAGVIAGNINLDSDFATTLGYIHDIGKKYGLNSNDGVIPHAINGYNYIKSLGYDEEYASICIKHSFLNNDINCLANDRDYTDSSNQYYDFMKEYIKKEYTIYEKIINLCDLMCTDKIYTVDKRIMDLLLRHGVYKNTYYHIKEVYKLKEYFDNLLGYNLYDLFPEIKENL